MITHLGDPRAFRRFAKVAPDGVIMAYVDVADGTAPSTRDLVDVTDDKTLWEGGKIKNYVPPVPPPPPPDWTAATTNIVLTPQDLRGLSGRADIIALVDAKVKAAAEVHIGGVVVAKAKRNITPRKRAKSS